MIEEEIAKRKAAKGASKKTGAKKKKVVEPEVESEPEEHEELA